jgi:CheY-like chemotaxis protein/anti-sigma regulatory factor (Ser/Thr protein kinase)
MEAGRVVFDFKRVEVRSLVERAIEATWGYAEGQGVRIRLEDGCAAGDVRADSDRLSQVVANLLSNAIKFSPTDSEVVVAIENEADLVKISVRDHGHGISAEFKPRVFERFAQADATNARKKGGTGLGLSIVKQIVDRLAGTVGFSEAPGGGTIFHVELPRWKHPTSMAIDSDAEPVASRILFCGDDIDTAVVLREQLRIVGFATDFAYTTADALASAAATRYRAVLVCRRLPDGDGTGLIVRLRELPHYDDATIIVVSADSVRGRDASRASKLNVSHWMNKPVDVERLIRALAEPAGSAVHAADTPAPIGHFDNTGVVAEA